MYLFSSLCNSTQASVMSVVAVSVSVVWSVCLSVTPNHAAKAVWPNIISFDTGTVGHSCTWTYRKAKCRDLEPTVTVWIASCSQTASRWLAAMLSNAKWCCLLFTAFSAVFLIRFTFNLCIMHSAYFYWSWLFYRTKWRPFCHPANWQDTSQRISLVLICGDQCKTYNKFGDKCLWDTELQQ